MFIQKSVKPFLNLSNLFQYLSIYIPNIWPKKVRKIFRFLLIQAQIYINIDKILIQNWLFIRLIFFCWKLFAFKVTSACYNVLNKILNYKRKSILFLWVICLSETFLLRQLQIWHLFIRSSIFSWEKKNGRWKNLTLNPILILESYLLFKIKISSKFQID